MSMVRAKLERKVILDFSKGKVTKNRIRQSLRKVELVEYLEVNDVGVIRDNIIQVGMFQIHIYPYALSTEPRNRIKEYGGLGFLIYERKIDSCGASWHKIKLARDKRFPNKQWLKLNKLYRIRMKHLVEIIHHCYRLDRLRIFL